MLTPIMQKQPNLPLTISFNHPAKLNYLFLAIGSMSRGAPKSFTPIESTLCSPVESILLWKLRSLNGNRDRKQNSVNVPLGVIRRESTPTYTLVSRLANYSHGRKSGMHWSQVQNKCCTLEGNNLISHNVTSSLLLIPSLQLVIHHCNRPSTSEILGVKDRTDEVREHFS